MQRIDARVPLLDVIHGSIAWRMAENPFMIPTQSRELAPVRYGVNEVRGVIYVTLRGDVTLEALQDVQETLSSDPRYRAGMAILLECRTITAIPMVSELRTLMLQRSFAAAARSSGRVAIVSQQQEPSVNCSQNLELCKSSFAGEVQLFREYSRARAWLGLPPTVGLY